MIFTSDRPKTAVLMLFHLVGVWAPSWMFSPVEVIAFWSTLCMALLSLFHYENVPIPKF